jgi:hypothetical protein
MKNTIPHIGILGLFLTCSSLSQAQTTQTITTVTSAGTIQQFTPDTFTIQSQSSSSPVSYTSTKTTTYVDENGNPVSVETVKSGAPVTVYYDQDGDKRVATKVVLKKTVTTDSSSGSMQETTQETTTTSSGTLSEFTPDAFVVQTDGSTAPASYTSTKTTTYVDDNGNPVSVETIKSGAPVTVYYEQEGGRMVATKVVLKNTASVQPDGSVIEHKKTTTTTTTSSSNQ